MRMAPYRTADNKVDGALLTFVDVSSVVQGEESVRLQVDAMTQRVHDLLTLAAELAIRTMREVPAPEAFAELYQRRVNALAQACSLMAHDARGYAALSAVMLHELAPHAGEVLDRISLEGPAILLRPRGVLALGVVVHALASQSAHDGALSVPSGLVSIRWQIEETADGPNLRWTWIANGVPVTAEPYDPALVELCVESQAQGRATIEEQNGSRRVTLTMKLDAVGNRTGGT